MINFEVEYKIPVIIIVGYRLETSLTPISYLVLVFHGSRNSQSQLAASWLAQLIIRELTSDSIVTQENYLEQQSSFLLSERPKKMTTVAPISVPIVLATALELATIPLHQKLVDLAHSDIARDCQKIRILPLFLTQGVHVTEDIPSQVALAQKKIAKDCDLEILPYLGGYRDLVTLLSRQFDLFGGGARILMAHGSRYRQANLSCQQLAESLQANLAYWSIAPSLSDRIRFLVDAGTTEIVILPYFLFPGRIYRAIADRVRELQENFPQVKLTLTPPLGATPELARLIVREISFSLRA